MDPAPITPQPQNVSNTRTATKQGIKTNTLLGVALILIGSGTLLTYAATVLFPAKSSYGYTPTLQISINNVSISLTKDYSDPSGNTFADAFIITNTENLADGWLLSPNNDSTYTPPGSQPTAVASQGFGFYEKSGDLSANKSAAIHAYVNNDMAAGTYKGSEKLIESRSDDSTIYIATITYILEVK